MRTRTGLAALGFVLAVSFAGERTAAAATGDFPAPIVTFGTTTSVEEMLSPVGLGRHTKAWRWDIGAPESTEAPPLRLAWSDADVDSPSGDAGPAQDAQPARRRPVAIQYSNAYAVRAKIHKWASFATLPLFGAQAVLGMKLDEGTTSEGVRATHAGIATSMVGLFGVNSVTGLWNLWDGRKDPNGRTKRLVHGFLMLGADGGFVATGLLAPTNEGGGNRDLHKTVAFTSIGVATAGYLLMLLTH